MAIKTVQELVTKIEEGVVRAIGDLPQMRKVAWAGGKAEFVVGQACPLDVHSRVVGLFGGEAEFRAYTMPLAPPDPAPPNWIVRPPSRISLTRVSQSYSVEEMNLDTMADLIIDEWNQVAEGVSSAEVERAAIVEWLLGMGPTTFTASWVAEQIQAEAHLEGEDDDEEIEDDEPEPEDAPSPPPVAPVIEPPAGA